MSWGQSFKIAIFNPWMGLQNQCVQAPVDTMSMCCRLGGTAMLNPMNKSNGNGNTADAKKDWGGQRG